MTADGQPLAANATPVAKARVDWPTRLHGLRLLLARAAWVVLMVMVAVLFSIATAAQFSASIHEALTTNRDGLAQLGVSAGSYATLRTGLTVTATLISLAIAVFLFVIRSDDWMVLLVSFVCFTVTPHTFDAVFALGTAQPVWRVPVMLEFGVGLTALALLVFTFPTGRFVPAWTRPAFIVFVVLVWAYMGANIVQQGLADPVPILIVCISLGCIAQVSRYRRTTSAVQRQQFRWIVFGMCVYAPTYVLILLLNAPLTRLPDAPRILYEIVGTVLLYYVPDLLVFVIVVFATLRYRLWDIDLLISRTLVYVPLTAILAGLFAASISLSQKLFIAFTGQSSDVAAALTTLIVVATFEPLKTRLQHLVEQRYKEARDPNAEIYHFGEEVQAVVQVLDAEQLARRFLEKAVRAYDATGGVVYLQRNRAGAPVAHTAGAGDGEVRLRVPLQHEGIEVGRLELGARKDGQDYDDAERAALQLTAERIAHALAVIQGL